MFRAVVRRRLVGLCLYWVAFDIGSLAFVAPFELHLLLAAARVFEEDRCTYDGRAGTR